MARYSGYGVIGLAMVLLGVLILIPFLKQMFPQIENFNNPLYKDTRLYNMLINRPTSEPKCNIVRRCFPGMVCHNYNKALHTSVGVSFGDPQQNGVCIRSGSEFMSDVVRVNNKVVSIYSDYLSSMQPMRDVKKEMQQQQVNNKGGTAWMNRDFLRT